MGILKYWILPGLLTVAVLGFAANVFKGDAIEADLSGKIKKSLADEHPWAEISLERRDVVLSGTAPTQDAAADAISRIETAYGVREIRDQSDLLPVASPYRFGVARTGAGIVLEGNAPDIQTRDAILSAAKKVASGAKVEDRLELAAGAPEGFTDLVDYSLQLLPMLRDAEIRLVDREVSVGGLSPNRAVFDKVASRLSEMPEGFQLADNSVLPPVATPYRWRLAKRGDGVTASGNVPSNAARQSTLEMLNSRFGEGRVVDRQELASGEPSGAEAARAVLARLLSMTEAGQANMVDTVVSIAGRVANEEMAAAVESGLAASLPDGFTGSVNLLLPRPPEPPVEALPLADPFVWNIEKSQDGIALGGNVSSGEEGAQILEVVRQNFPGFEVADQQVPARGSPENIKTVRDVLIAQVRLMDEGKAAVSGDTISLSGKLKNPNLARLVRRTLETRLPANYKVSEPELVLPEPEPEPEPEEPETAEPLLPVADPFRWSISRSPEGVTLIGNVSSEEERVQLVEIAGDLPGVTDVSDRQVAARGAPEGFADARRLVIRQLRLLEAGRGNLIGDTVEIEGNAKNENIARLVERVIKTRLPEGYSGVVRIRYPETEKLEAPEIVFREPEPEVEPISEPEPEPAKEPEPVVLTQEEAKCQQEVIDAVDGRKIRFETARAIIRQESTGILDDVARAAAECPEIRFRVEGHTDSRGRSGYNRELSKARADAVLRYLRNAGADENQFEAVGYGETRPVADNTTASGRAQNRRIVFKVVR